MYDTSLHLPGASTAVESIGLGQRDENPRRLHPLIMVLQAGDALSNRRAYTPLQTDPSRSLRPGHAILDTIGRH